MRKSQEIESLLKEHNFTPEQLNKSSYIVHKKNNAARIALEYRQLMKLETPLVNVAANPSE